MAHELEIAYQLSAAEILDAVAKRFRLKAALEGAMGEVQMERKIKAVPPTIIEKYEPHDRDGWPDFSIWLPGRPEPLRAECKSVRTSKAEDGAAYKKNGQVVAYKVETQKTRPSANDPTTRSYSIDHFDILGVCLGKKTGNWSDLVFARTSDLERDSKNPGKLAKYQRVPLPDATDRGPWYADLGQLLQEKFAR